MRLLAASLLALLIAAALFFGIRPTTPARTFEDYSLKAKDTAESALSSVETARLAANVGSGGKAFGPYVSVVLSEADQGINHAQGSFESIQPPDSHADAVRRRLSHLLTRSSDAVAQLRITARRGDLDALGRQAKPLPRLARRLERFISTHG